MGLGNPELMTITRGKPMQNLIKDLVLDADHEHSQYLRELNDKFIVTCESKKIEVFCYYETKRSPIVQVRDPVLMLQDSWLNLS